MAELLGLVASVVQVVGAGLKLSETLYQYGESVATADSRIKNIAKEIRLTSFVIEELGTIFQNDETSALISKNAVRTADATMKECSTVFAEIEETLQKTKKTRFGKLLLPFKDKHIELLRSHIDKLKSTLQLLMQVLTHAQQVASHKLDREAEAKQREQIKHLLDIKKKSTEKYEQSLKNINSSDESTSSDNERDLDLPLVPEPSSEALDQSSVLTIAAAIGSTINTEALATCVKHIRSLLGNIENLQQALDQHKEGDDHSDHHQNLIGTYLQSREHLDEVLLGSAKTKKDSIGSGKASAGAGADILYSLGTGSKISGTSLSNATTINGNSIDSNSQSTLRDNHTVSREDPDMPMLNKERSGGDGDDTPTNSVQQPIKIEIGSGRLYCFPYESCKNWNNVYKRITQVIELDDQLQKDIFNGRFRILTEDGDVILPEKWDELVEPGSSFTLQYQDLVAVDSPFGKYKGLDTHQPWEASVHNSDHRISRISAPGNSSHENPFGRTGNAEQPSLFISDLDEIESNPVERVMDMNSRTTSKRTLGSNTSLEYSHSRSTEKNDDWKPQGLRSDKVTPFAFSHKGNLEDKTISTPLDESKTDVTHFNSKRDSRYRRRPPMKRRVPGQPGLGFEQTLPRGDDDSDEEIYIRSNIPQKNKDSWAIIKYDEELPQENKVPDPWAYGLTKKKKKGRVDEAWAVNSISVSMEQHGESSSELDWYDSDSPPAKPKIHPPSKRRSHGPVIPTQLKRPNAEAKRLAQHAAIKERHAMEASEATSAMVEGHRAGMEEGLRYQPVPVHYQPVPIHYQPAPAHYQSVPVPYQPVPARIPMQQSLDPSYPSSVQAPPEISETYTTKWSRNRRSSMASAAEQGPEDNNQRLETLEPESVRRYQITSPHGSARDEKEREKRIIAENRFNMIREHREKEEERESIIAGTEKEREEHKAERERLLDIEQAKMSRVKHDRFLVEMEKEKKKKKRAGPRRKRIISEETGKFEKLAHEEADKAKAPEMAPVQSESLDTSSEASDEWYRGSPSRGFVARALVAPPKLDKRHGKPHHPSTSARRMKGRGREHWSPPRKAVDRSSSSSGSDVVKLVDSVRNNSNSLNAPSGPSLRRESKPTVEDYDSDDSDASIHSREISQTSVPQARANISTKRSEELNLGQAQQVVAEGGKEIKTLSSTTREDYASRPLIHQASSYTKNISAENKGRRPTRIYLGANRDECFNPFCVTCQPHVREGRPSLMPSAPVLMTSNSVPPPQRPTSSTYSSYNQGPAIIQPSLTRYRLSSNANRRPQSYADEPSIESSESRDSSGTRHNSHFSVGNRMRHNSMNYKDVVMRREDNEENVKQVRFEVGRAAARERDRAEAVFAEMNKERAAARAEARRRIEAERNSSFAREARDSQDAKAIPEPRAENLDRTTLTTDAEKSTSTAKGSKDDLAGDEVDALLREWTNVFD